MPTACRVMGYNRHPQSSKSHKQWMKTIAVVVFVVVFGIMVKTWCGCGYHDAGGPWAGSDSPGMTILKNHLPRNFKSTAHTSKQTKYQTKPYHTIHAYMHVTYIHAYIHPSIHIYLLTCIHAHIHTQTYICSYIHIHMRTCVYACILSDTCKHT